MMRTTMMMMMRKRTKIRRKSRVLWREKWRLSAL
jgi:hypothetical protein